MLPQLRRLKEWVESAVPLPQPAVLGVIGLACFLGTCLVLRKPLSWGWALAPGIVLAVAIEAWEVWDHYGESGFGRTSVAGVVARHLLDVAVMNLPAAVVWGVAFLRRGGTEVAS